MVGMPASRGSTSIVNFCTTGRGEAVVLKVSPVPTLGAAEAAAFAAWWSSRRVPRVLEFDKGSGALLLEAVVLLSESERKGVGLDQIAGLVRELHGALSKEALAGFPPLVERLEFLFALYRDRLRASGVSPLMPSSLFESSLKKARELALRPGPRVLLHGDRQAGNVLDGGPERKLVAVDPRACVGDPAFDLVDWVLIPEASSLERRADRRVGEVGLDREALRCWCECTDVLVASIRLLGEGAHTGFTRTLLKLAAGSLA